MNFHNLRTYNALRKICSVSRCLPFVNSAILATSDNFPKINKEQRMPHFAKPIRFIEQFLCHFQPLFSKTQMNILRQMIYAMFFDYKRLNLSALAKRAHIDYQKLQYFFSESEWSVDQINNIRLKILQHQNTTRATIKGVMAIDDTAVPKPHAEKTEGAQFQYCGTLGRQENCNVAVASCFVSNSKHFPVNFKSYIPVEGAASDTFKSKIDLAKDLITDAIEKKIPFSSIVFDAWYTSSELIEFIHSKNLNFVAEIKSNRSIRLTHPQTRQWNNLRADLIVPLIKKFYPHKIKPVVIPQNNGKTKTVLTYTFKSTLKGCSTPLNIIFMFDKWSESDDKNIHILITNNLTLSTKSVLLTYLLRWGIEESFRELKDDFCFDQFQVRHQEQIRRHWILSFLAWSLTYWIKQNACLSKIIQDSPTSISQCKESVAALIIIDSACLLSKNPNHPHLQKIKSQRFKERLKN